MDNDLIGFRMKFSKVQPEEIERIIEEYLKKFHRYEIKITNQIISSGKIKAILNVSNKLASGKFSLHLSKDVLNSLDWYNEISEITKYLKEMKYNDELYLVTHIPREWSKDIIDRILILTKKLPKNCMLLLENEKVQNENYEYLNSIERLFTCLSQKKINNIGFCLDIGHLLCGFHNENIEQQQVWEYLANMQISLKQLREIHIHDYNQNDHLKLTEGTMNLELVSDFLLAKEILVPIIIEVTVSHSIEDAIQQISIVQKLI